MAIKRIREDFESSIAMANYLLLLSSRPGLGLGLAMGSEARGQSTGRVFECKTCNKQFPSFQALGGHRASHKRPRPGPGFDLTMMISPDDNQAAHNAGKPKTHGCSICGLEFAIGQALGGHMRRHRTALTGSHHLPPPSNKERNINGDDHHDHDKRANGLDLNLTPLENGLLEIEIVAPIFC